MKPYVALGMPGRKKVRLDHMVGIASYATAGDCAVLPLSATSSLLNFNFCRMLAETYNFLVGGYPLTHLALLHDDIEPEMRWLDTLVAELDASGADMISAYAPIKTGDGLVSMATYQDDMWDFNRFTIRQLAEMPETFTQDDVDGNLMINTGCCVLRLLDPWKSNPWDFTFESHERIVLDAEGKAVTQVLSEDWVFSDKIRKAGGKLAATRKVGLGHEGEYTFRNDTIWGRMTRDEAYHKKHGENHESQIPAGRELQAERS
jgi:hypothetical protein